MSKLKFDEFCDFIKEHDINIFLETKTDKYDEPKLPPGYTFYAKHRSKFKNKSGGIVIIYKDYLEPFLVFPKSDSEFVQWIKVSNKILDIEKKLITWVYIHPTRKLEIHFRRCF